ncbi:MAG TPA: glycosyltransferase family 2 protein [Gemmatimonadales bacterium]|nr:glycosyltransferase family 2 protein [Gemmatimonadales bacterium]
MIQTVAIVLLVLPILLMGWAYLGYPLALRILSRILPVPRQWEDPPEWPEISIVVPAYNEERNIRRTVESLLALDYPADRRQIVVISDASTDSTDQIVSEYADRGVELSRMPQRSGKTAAENAVLPRLRGSIVVNTDATIRILPDALKPLIRVFQDPTIGVASGRDVSVSDITVEANAGESGYVGYEMWVRSLETRVGSIVGASGCFYAIRQQLHRITLPAELSRDFASALVAREHGFRAVSVDAAVCLVPRTGSLQREYRRKARTMARGLQTLWYKRHLLNPVRYGAFAWMLWSHKLVRWLVFLTAPFALVGLALLALESPIALVGFILAVIGCLLGTIAMRAPEGRRLPRLVTISGFVLATHLAGFLAWTKALRGESNSIWEPTRRTA